MKALPLRMERSARPNHAQPALRPRLQRYRCFVSVNRSEEFIDMVTRAAWTALAVLRALPAN
jgi:hypothetical protein